MSTAPIPLPVSPTAAFSDVDRTVYLDYAEGTDEKIVSAQKIIERAASIEASSNGVRFADVGTGNGTVFAAVMDGLHNLHPHLPIYALGKEISGEDTHICLRNMPGCLERHPETVVVMTNMNNNEAPWLTPARPELLDKTIWMEVALEGDTSADFARQIDRLKNFVDENWVSEIRPSGSLAYKAPVALVLYRQDHCAELEHLIPVKGQKAVADFDFIFASHSFRASRSNQFKAARIAPWMHALKLGGGFFGTHSCGGDSAAEIAQIFPRESGQKFFSDHKGILAATAEVLGEAASQFNFCTKTEIFDCNLLAIPPAPTLLDAATLRSVFTRLAYVAQLPPGEVEKRAAAGMQVIRDIVARDGRESLTIKSALYAIIRNRAPV